METETNLQNSPFTTYEFSVCSLARWQRVKRRLTQGNEGEEDEAQALTGVYLEARHVKFAHVELHTDDGEHDNGEEQQQADLEQGDHGLHDGLQHHLETCRGQKKVRSGTFHWREFTEDNSKCTSSGQRIQSDLLGIPDTSFRGLSTRTARSVRRSKSDPTVARILQGEQQQPSEDLLHSVTVKVVPLVRTCRLRRAASLKSEQEVV